MYVTQVLSGAVDEKSSGRPGAAVEGIHDFVELQGCAETVRAAKAPVAITAIRVPPTCGERKAKHLLALQQQRRRIMRVRWQGFGAVVRCQFGPPSCSPYPDQTPLPRHQACFQCAGQATAVENLITFGPKFCPNP